MHPLEQMFCKFRVGDLVRKKDLREHVFIFKVVGVRDGSYLILNTFWSYCDEHLVSTEAFDENYVLVEE